MFFEQFVSMLHHNCTLSSNPQEGGQQHPVFNRHVQIMVAVSIEIIIITYFQSKPAP